MIIGDWRPRPTPSLLVLKFSTLFRLFAVERAVLTGVNPGVVGPTDLGLRGGVEVIGFTLFVTAGLKGERARMGWGIDDGGGRL